MFFFVMRVIAPVVTPMALMARGVASSTRGA